MEKKIQGEEQNILLNNFKTLHIDNSTDILRSRQKYRSELWSNRKVLWYVYMYR